MDSVGVAVYDDTGATAGLYPAATFVGEGVVVVVLVLVQNYNLAGCFVWVWKLAAHIEGGM